MKKSVKLSYFLFQAHVLAKSIGLLPYDDDIKPERFPNLMTTIFALQLINMNFVLLIEMLFIFVSIAKGEHFKEATMTLAYSGFAVVSNIKIVSVLHKKSLLTILMRSMRQMYPRSMQLQSDLDAHRCGLRYNLVSFGFVSIHMILIWWYNLYPAMRYLIYDYWLAVETVPITLPYYVWVPWQWQGHWSYYFLYGSMIMAGHTAMSSQLASDLLLCAIATQIAMHYRYLAQRIETYQPCEIYKRDSRFLRGCIQYHQKILSLSYAMNEVFGVSLLVNFVSSTFIMCFLGFEMTVGVQADGLIMLFIFLFCSLLQIYMICSYGEDLIVKSEGIGHAAYAQNWINTDVRYRKMLTLIIERSQKSALLKATRFLKVSLGTMTDLVQLSYKFYAVIRTMYSK